MKELMNFIKTHNIEVFAVRHISQNEHEVNEKMKEIANQYK